MHLESRTPSHSALSLFLQRQQHPRERAFSCNPKQVWQADMEPDTEPERPHTRILKHSSTSRTVDLFAFARLYSTAAIDHLDLETQERTILDLARGRPLREADSCRARGTNFRVRRPQMRHCNFAYLCGYHVHFHAHQIHCCQIQRSLAFVFQISACTRPCRR